MGRRRLGRQRILDPGTDLRIYARNWHAYTRVSTEPGIRDSSPLCVILALVVLSIEETVRLLRLTTDYMRAWAST